MREIEPGDIVMFGNNGTNGMGSYFEDDVNYYLDAAEAMGARIIINSYTPHGAVSKYASGYHSSTHTFNSYRKDSYDNIVREVAAERAASDPNYLGFVEIGKNADAAFNAYVADYEANGYASADAAAQAINACFSDHNHYSNGTIARELMLNGYGNVKGIVEQLTEILTEAAADDANWTYDYDDAIVETKGNDAATGWLVTVTNGAKRTAYGFNNITAQITSGGVTKTFTKNYGTAITLDAGGAAKFGIVIAGLNDDTATISVEVE